MNGNIETAIASELHVSPSRKVDFDMAWQGLEASVESIARITDTSPAEVYHLLALLINNSQEKN